MNGFRETALRTDGRTNERDSLGLQRLRRETKKKCENLHFWTFWAKKAKFGQFFFYQNGQNGENY